MPGINERVNKSKEKRDKGSLAGQNGEYRREKRVRGRDRERG